MMAAALSTGKDAGVREEALSPVNSPPAMKAGINASVSAHRQAEQ